MNTIEKKQWKPWTTLKNQWKIMKNNIEKTMKTNEKQTMKKHWKNNEVAFTKYS